MSPQVSVIVATRNRGEYLCETLHDLLCQAFPPTGYEVIVVDNNSSDETRLVAEGARAVAPERLRYLFEPRQGKSYALNTGIEAARGEIVAFVDDDVRVEGGWLSGLNAGCGREEITGCGGRVFLQFEGQVPAWLTPSLRAALGEVDLGDHGLETSFNFPGMNVAFRREVFRRHGGFRTDMGPGIRGAGRHNEDTEFLLRIRRGGERIWYAPDAIVRHRVPATRLTKRYFRRRFVLEGLSHAHLMETPLPLWRLMVRQMKRAGRSLWRFAAAVSHRSSIAFAHECEVIRHLTLAWKLCAVRVGRVKRER